MLSAKYLTGSHEKSGGKLATIWAKWNDKFEYWTDRYGKFLTNALEHRKKNNGHVSNIIFG